MRIFLDVGSHFGETLDEVLKPKYKFDKVYCFEPSNHALNILNKKFSQDSRVEICPFGLSNSNDRVPLYMPGTLSGSIFEEANNDNCSNQYEEIELRDASQWLNENIGINDFVVMKTNCEGSEIYIIDSLLKSNLLSNIYSLLVTFDIREFQGHEYKERMIRKRLRQSGLNNFCFSEDVMFGSSHNARIANWLRLFGIHEDGLDASTLKLRYQRNFEKYSRKNGYFYYLESRVKAFIKFKYFPEFLKVPFRVLKKILWTNREKN